MGAECRHVPITLRDSTFISQESGKADEAMQNASVDALTGDRVSHDRQRLGDYLDLTA